MKQMTAAELRPGNDPAHASVFIQAGASGCATRHPIRVPAGWGGTDYSRIPVLGGQSGAAVGPSGRRLSAGGVQNGRRADGPERGMTTTGSGAISFSYAPESGDKSTKILFLQVMQEKLDGTPCKPGKYDPASNYLDAYTTGDFYHVDSPTPGEKDPFMNGDDAIDFGVQGNAVAKPQVTATAGDTPNVPDAAIPAGSSRINWDFRTAAFSAAGEDAGTYYGYSDWGFEKQRGIASTTTIVGTKTGAPGSKFDAAVKLFNDVKGFKMPAKGASLLGGIVGGALGLVGGAAIGFGLGGAPGAVIGGVIGLVGGALLGAFG